MRALVIGDSGGIGGAVAEVLHARGADVVGLSRARTGFDLLSPDAAEEQIAALDDVFDLIFVATGALVSTRERPEKSLKEVSAAELAEQFAINAIGPALVLRHAPRLLARAQRGVFAVLSARVGSIGDNRAGGWYSYRASKAALNQIVHTGAIELARTHKQAVCVALHPGTVETSFTAGFSGREKLSAEESATRLLDVLNGLDAGDTGGFFDYSGAPVVW
ncbi:NAD(P)-dependent dehydrogenase (short-subunit alcohol dehydrogenase family) [Shimia isoporae]|uniref:NAD(P)-dependent dehydrogenase (Short-subunit alcohol dehydrogenase family) n=1 Tax=Shimia isoporae TaxID=647720 RepID=A0A4R1NTS6_9RHOB|nr:SDR family NAD(P)-dependent oxidoreductase [Shimia isoporae]TCL08412.1 NAD(P)-dependent dehydrogenase (short-subunit alcohol dehydrogenase family) [Shimia isoporae]